MKKTYESRIFYSVHYSQRNWGIWGQTSEFDLALPPCVLAALAVHRRQHLIAVCRSFPTCSNTYIRRSDFCTLLPEGTLTRRATKFDASKNRATTEVCFPRETKADSSRTSAGTTHRTTKGRTAVATTYRQ